MANVTFDPTVAHAVDACDGAVPLLVVPSGLPLGVAQVRATATDTAGNTDACDVTVEVVDAEAPVLVCPAAVALAAGSTCTASVVYSAPQVTDNCPGAAILSVSGPAVGAAVRPGQYAVSVLAADSASNIVRCSFGVSVRDTDAPVFGECLLTSTSRPSHTHTNTFLHVYRL